MNEIPYTYLLCQALYRSERCWGEKFTGGGSSIGPTYGAFYQVDHEQEYKGCFWYREYITHDWIWGG